MDGGVGISRIDRASKERAPFGAQHDVRTAIESRYRPSCRAET